MDKTMQQAFEKRLFEHRKNKANIKILESKLQQLDLQLYYHNIPSGETYDECVAGMAIKANILSHMPHSVTNKFTSIVENVVINMNKTELKSKFNMDCIIEEITCIIKAISILHQRVDEIDMLIDCLGDKHKYVVEKYYIAKIKDNNEVAAMYCDVFGKPVGEVRIQQLRVEAVREMMSLIGKKEPL